MIAFIVTFYIGFNNFVQKYKDDEKVCYYLNDFFKKINEYKYIFISPNFQNIKEVSEKINLKSFDFYFNEWYSCLKEMKMVKLISFDYYFDKWNACLCNHSSFNYFLLCFVVSR